MGGAKEQPVCLFSLTVAVLINLNRGVKFDFMEVDVRHANATENVSQIKTKKRNNVKLDWKNQKLIRKDSFDGIKLVGTHINNHEMFYWLGTAIKTLPVQLFRTHWGKESYLSTPTTVSLPLLSLSVFCQRCILRFSVETLLRCPHLSSLPPRKKVGLHPWQLCYRWPPPSLTVTSEEATFADHKFRYTHTLILIVLLSLWGLRLRPSLKIDPQPSS